MQNQKLRRLSETAAICALAWHLCACSTDTQQTVQATAIPPSPVAEIRPDAGSASAPPTSLPPISAGKADLATTQSTTEFYPGSGSFVGNSAPVHRAQTAVGAEGDITLNFVNADVKDVAKAILGDYLKLNYEISPVVQGNVTIQTSQPLERSKVLAVLQQVLRLNGVALVEANGIYRIVPLTEARSQSGSVVTGSEASSALGYGIEIMPVRYISATAMQKLLEPLAPTQGVIHVDAIRNILIVEGTQEERQTIRENIALFDTDWLSGMSYAIYTPKFTDADELSKEINEIIGGTSSPIAGVVKLVTIGRLNAILAISPQQKYLEQLDAWVTRLDRPGQGTDRRMYVYHVQNGRAADLAATLTKTFGNNVSDGSPTPPPDIGTPGVAGIAQRTGVTPAAGVTAGSVGRVNITADETNNALVILATPPEFSTIEAALRQLDVAPLQVFLEAAIAEITLTDGISYGVQYFYQPGPESTLVNTTTKTSAISALLPGFSYMFTRGTNIKIILDALSSVTHIEVVSSPQVMVLNNQTATLQVGDRVPIATQQAVGVTTASSAIVNTIQYQDTGVILKVTPRVNRGGMVLMDISQEVSQVSPTTSSTIDSPTIQQRKINSSVAIQDGETVALGGLITDNRNKGSSGMPLLSKIPVVGGLFGHQGDNATRTELMVLITPRVVNSLQQARAVTDELRRKLPTLRPVFERGQ